MESKKINQLATELAPDLSDLTIIGDPTTGISKKITLSQMASLFTGTVEEYATLAAFPLVGVADTIYIALDTNIIYRYDTSLSAYVILSPNIINSLVFSDANGFDGTITLVGSVATLSITTALTLGSVPFIGASGALIQDNSNLFFDDTNNRLGINTNAPTTALDVFGSGIIGRLNATSTNNAYLGFASNGTNKWSAGNVQSDHRFRIFSEANSAELITILQTGEFGIGIANPTTKLHIDGAASALIANLDANVSIAKSVSYRSDNSARINLEVSGTESGSNAGADFFLRTFTDAGSLLETPFTIVRSTGVTTIKSLTLTNVLSVANGGTGSATQNFVDLTSVQTAAGAKTFSAITTISNATASTSTTTGGLVVTGGVGIGGALFGTSATFSSTLTATQATFTATANTYAGGALILKQFGGTNPIYLTSAGGSFAISNGGSADHLLIASTGAATFSSSVTAGGNIIGATLITSPVTANPSSTSPAFYQPATGELGINVNGGERMRIASNGNVGIGISPSYKLHVNGTIWTDQVNFPNGGARVTTTDGGSYVFLNGADGGVPNIILFGAGSAERMRLSAAGELYIGQNTGSYKLTLNGQPGANGYTLWTNYSDIRLKENITDLEVTNVLDKICAIRPVTYNYNELSGYDEQTRNRRISGFIAQELMEVFPDMVGTIVKDKIEYYDTNLSNLNLYLVKAIQEQQLQIEELKALIAAK